MPVPRRSDVIEWLVGIVFLAATYLFVQFVTIAYHTAWYSEDNSPDLGQAWYEMKCHYTKECEQGSIYGMVDGA